MTVTEQTRPPRALTAAYHQADVNREEIEQVAALGPGILLRGAEVGMFLFIGLLVCPPLAILVVVVVVPLLVTALVLGLLAAVLSAPYLLVHHFRRHDRRHASLLAHRLRRAGRALLDLLPHRIVADAGKLDHAGR
jgi:Flp pilus assembly protein TadB